MKAPAKPKDRSRGVVWSENFSRLFLALMVFGWGANIWKLFTLDEPFAVALLRFVCIPFFPGGIILGFFG